MTILFNPLNDVTKRTDVKELGGKWKRHFIVLAYK